MFDYIIVGAGQAGLSMAYQLKQANEKFLVLDSESEIGASWLKRWDSLRLFTPTEFNHLPGMPFPAEDGYYPDKYDVANYFKSYVNQYKLPIELKTKVLKVVKMKDAFDVHCQHKLYQCKRIIIASGPFHTPFIPSFYKSLSSDIKQIHSSDYRNPEQLIAGDTVVVGAGDSGFQILREIALHCSDRHVFFSGSTNSLTIPQEFLGKTLWWWFNVLGILSVNKYSWIGKKIKQKMQPVIGIDIKSLLSRKNVTAVGHALEGQNSSLRCKYATLDSVKNIIWSTGFKPDFSWIEDIELDEHGYPVNFRGVSSTKGMYFIGLPWMYTRGSATLGGVRKDSEYLIKALQKNA
ncbi:potassium transporter Trk [Shewanella sp. OPT22]|nr:potassium transporter Trk [Shewanella sp. OPT22]